MTVRNYKALLALLPAILALALPAFAGHPKNWVQRHPTLTAIGAGVATHHALKVSARNRKLHGQKLNWAQRHPTLSAIGVGAATHHVIKKSTPP
ncbi:MAG: hypothetical protein JO250_15745 [Armatimonadetes bacterium]|nr:hypothetical protein [Armatimonadota bacterium]